VLPHQLAEVGRHSGRINRVQVVVGGVLHVDKERKRGVLGGLGCGRIRARVWGGRVRVRVWR
jgi:hypothetical protein